MRSKRKLASCGLPDKRKAMICHFIPSPTTSTIACRGGYIHFGLELIDLASAVMKWVGKKEMMPPRECNEVKRIEVYWKRTVLILTKAQTYVPIGVFVCAFFMFEWVSERASVCVCVCMWVQGKHVCMQACMYMHACTCVCERERVRACMCRCVYICLCMCMCVYVHVCLCKYISVCVYAYACDYVYKRGCAPLYWT